MPNISGQLFTISDRINSTYHLTNQRKNLEKAAFVTTKSTKSSVDHKAPSLGEDNLESSFAKETTWCSNNKSCPPSSSVLIISPASSIGDPNLFPSKCFGTHERRLCSDFIRNKETSCLKSTSINTQHFVLPYERGSSSTKDSRRDKNWNEVRGNSSGGSLFDIKVGGQSVCSRIDSEISYSQKVKKRKSGCGNDCISSLRELRFLDLGKKIPLLKKHLLESTRNNTRVEEAPGISSKLEGKGEAGRGTTGVVVCLQPSALSSDSLSIGESLPFPIIPHEETEFYLSQNTSEESALVSHSTTQITLSDNQQEETTTLIPLLVNRKSISVSLLNLAKAINGFSFGTSSSHNWDKLPATKMDHEDLISELPQIEKLSNQERLRLAHKRRMIQLKKFQQYDREIASRKRKAVGKPGGKGRIRFRNSIMLLEAAGRNDVDEVRKLLSSGVSPDVCNEDGLTALHQCCIDDNEEMMKVLLDYGANVNSEDSERWTPLHAAATCGHLHLVKYLIAKGANLLAVNAEGNMPYDICDEEATLDYIESEMAKRGVTQELIEETRALPETQMLKDMQNILSKGGDLEYRDPDGATPLHVAAANGYYRVVEFLLDNHSATDVQDKDNWQPIHAAACWGHLDVLELLVQNGADLNARTRNNETPYAICEDGEIKERIIQLRSELETKQQEAARARRLRRTQSSNSRTQSIRRTSQRDKGLTSKRDTAIEAKILLERDPSLKDNSPSPTADLSNAANSHASTTEGSSTEEDAEDQRSLPPAALGRDSRAQINVPPNELEKLQQIAAKGIGTSGSSSESSKTTTINNNLKPNNVKNNNLNSNINNSSSKQFTNPISIPVTDTNANLPKPEINPEKQVQIGTSGISLSGSRDSLTGVGNSTIDIHVSVTINTSSPSSTLTNGGGTLAGGTNNYPPPGQITPYISSGITPGSTLLTPPGTLADLKKHRSLIRTSSNPINGGVLNDLPNNKFEKPPSPSNSLRRFTGDEIVGDYGDGGKKCCAIV